MICFFYFYILHFITPQNLKQNPSDITKCLRDPSSINQIIYNNILLYDILPPSHMTFCHAKIFILFVYFYKLLNVYSFLLYAFVRWSVFASRIYPSSTSFFKHLTTCLSLIPNVVAIVLIDA